MRSGLRGRFLLFVASTALTLLSLEVVFRVVAWREDRRALEFALANPAPLPTDRSAWLREILQISADDRIVYELRPAIEDVSFVGASLSTNERGFRGPEVTTPKPRGWKRIVGIGDSTQFGWGVEREEAYLELLARGLSSQGGQHWDAVNTGVPGYNTVMEVRTLREKALDLEPDLVVLGLVANDLQLPNFIRARSDVFALNESFLLRVAREGLDAGTAAAPKGLVDSPREGDGGFGFESDPHRVPPQYEDMVGWAPFEAALDELAEMRDAHGFDVVAVSLWKVAPLDRMLAACEARGFTTVLAEPAIGGYIRANDLEHYQESEMTVSLTDPHPSAITHGLIAEVLLDRIATARGH
ncbi:MAG: GDSL-type esterase/lipase family protein [Candidatus Binatia bacterium]|nr:GDSL-type esterase/lipase family protein [Candidatus Binatia bacterium]